MGPQGMPAGFGDWGKVVSLRKLVRGEDVCSTGEGARAGEETTAGGLLEFWVKT